MEHKADRHQIPVLFLGKIHIAQAKQEEVAFDTLLLDEQAPHAQHLPKNLLWITTSNTGPAWPLEHPVPAGTLLLAAACPNRTACHSLPLGTGQHGVTGDGKVSRLQGLSDHKFLDSRAQEQGVWSKHSNDRWWTSRDPFWSRALPNPSVRNSSSYFFPPNVDLANFIAWHSFWIGFHVPWRAWAQMTFHRAVSLEALRRFKKKHWPKHKQKQTLKLFRCHIALPSQRQAIESRSKHTCLKNNKHISQS